MLPLVLGARPPPCAEQLVQPVRWVRPVQLGWPAEEVRLQGNKRKFFLGLSSGAWCRSTHPGNRREALRFMGCREEATVLGGPGMPGAGGPGMALAV